jgi:hypothetical protein
MANTNALKNLARRKAQKYGLDPDIFVAQINPESGLSPDVVYGRRSSSAGAQGIAQIMPDTAKGWGVNPLKPKQALDAAARNMASYVKQFGSYDAALRAYNAGPGNVKASHGFAETNNYVKTILGGKSPSTKGVGSSAGQTSVSGVTGLNFGKDQIGSKSVFDQEAFQAATRKAQIGAWYASKHPGSILARVLPQVPPNEADFTSENLTFKPGKVLGEQTSTFGSRSSGRSAGQTGPLGKVSFVPTADRAGVGTNKPIKTFARQVAAIAGRPLTVGTGTNHSRMTASGNISDHWAGNAVDIPATGAELREIGRAALIAAGMPRKKALKQKGGLYNIGGHQIIFGINRADLGDHTNHLHISAT